MDVLAKPASSVEMVTHTFGSVDTWETITSEFEIVFDAEVYDQTNQQKIDLDVRILPDYTLQVRSKKIITTTIKIFGA